MPKTTSIYTAELYAIIMAVTLIKDSNDLNFVIMSDSSSVLISFNNKNTKNSMLRKLLHELNEINATNKNVSLCWIPGHVDIAGNEAADTAAKLAARRAPQFITIPYTDWYPLIKERMSEKWKEVWMSRRLKIAEINFDVKTWSKKNISRREEVIMNRLRAGYSYITHGYLMDSSVPDIAPVCELCNNSVLTVKHIMVQCPELQQQRLRAITMFNKRRTVSLQSLLGDCAPVKQIMCYLKNINIYSLV